jgi:hypothetical protein
LRASMNRRLLPDIKNSLFKAAYGRFSYGRRPLNWR